ncbi:hypothetical protein PMI06_004866 [Burkholderia sp. BT03]|jgi:hypothetical protein|nr:hypothetical protein PMI06_004866 [Burkholderia sp. BT03]SKC77766.1 hypothetical protein SAMN06266956_3143 [Paraburkholderia hospita]
MKSKRQKRRTRVCPETSRVLTYALSGVAKELARLIGRHLTRRRKALTRRGETGMSKRDVFRLLCQAFSRALLNPRGDVALAAKQRNALAFALAAADVPAALHVSGVPKELRRVRKRGRRL